MGKLLVKQTRALGETGWEVMSPVMVAMTQLHLIANCYAT